MRKHRTLKILCIVCAALLGAALLVFLCTGCLGYRCLMSDKRVLEEARIFVSALDPETCGYRVVADGGTVRSGPCWKLARLPQYPGGQIYFDGSKTYFCEDASRFSEGDAADGRLPDKAYVREISDFSFEPYDAAADAWMQMLKCNIDRPDVLEIRYKRGDVIMPDYLYFDLSESYLNSEAFLELAGKRYDGGFVCFVYLGKWGAVSECSVVLWDYAADGKTELRTHQWFEAPRDPNA